MKIKDVTKEYPNKDLTIVWKPKRCIHSEKCWRNLPEVFRYGKKPWIDPKGAFSDRISTQINQCPSGALSYYWNEDGKTQSNGTTVQVLSGGPLVVKGNFELIKPDGSTSVEQNAALCRCGASENKPFCDNSHQKTTF